MPFLVPSMSSPLRMALMLSFVAIAIFGCAKEDDTQEQHLSRANGYLAAEQYYKAEKEYREVLRIAPTDPVAQRQLGIIYLDQGQLPQAYPLLKKAAELKPDDLEVQLKLGQALLSLARIQASAGRSCSDSRETAGT